MYVVLNVLVIISVFCSFPLLYFAARNNLILMVKILMHFAKKKEKNF